MNSVNISHLIDEASEIMGLKGNTELFDLSNGDKLYYKLPSSFLCLIRLFGIKKTVRIILSRKTKKLVKISLKGDSVVFPLGYNNGVVIASSRKNEAIKLVFGENSARKVDNEVTAGKLLNGHQDICPMVKKDGISENGYRWMIQELWPDSEPIQIHEAHGFVHSEIADALHSVYQTAGITSTHLKSWIIDIDGKASGQLRTSDAYKSIRKKILDHPGAESFSIKCSRVHGDFYLKHIHRNRKGWRIIDWGHFEHGNIVEDWLSIELKTERNRWYSRSILSRIEEAESVDDVNSSLFYDWPGPLLNLVYGSEINDLNTLKLLIYVALLERLVRIEDLVQVNPVEIDWLMTTLDAV